MTAKELYDRGTDVRDYEIPTEWFESFKKFMFGSTCTADVDENGKVINYVYYIHDFRGWYHLNEKQIVRDEKLNKIIDKKNPL